MKKTFLLGSIFLASVLVGCRKYESRRQAEIACNEWKNKGERIDYLVHWGTSDSSEMYVMDRTCKLEEATSQILGFQGELSRKAREAEGERVFWRDKLEPINLKVVKKFYF